MSKYLSLQNQILLLLIAVALVRGLIYAGLTVPWSQAHDEEIHFIETKAVVDQWTSGQSSLNWPQEMAATFAPFPKWRWNETPERAVNLVDFQNRYLGTERSISLSYRVYGWAAQFLVRQDLLFQLFTLRVVSVFMTAGTIIFAFLSAREIFAKATVVQILVPWLILFNPSFMVINSAINDGNLTVFATSGAFFLLLLDVKQSRLGWRAALAIALTTIALWSKATAYFLLPVWGVLLSVVAWRIGRRYWPWLGTIAGLLLVALLFLPDYFKIRLLQIWTFAQSGDLADGMAYAFSFDYLRDTFASFWIILGFLVYRLAPGWYMLLFSLTALSILGLLLYFWRFFKQPKPALAGQQKGLLLSLLFAGAAIGVLLAYVALRNSDGMRLGRYIFPAIVPISILLVAGWRELLPARWQDMGLMLLIAFFFLFDTMFWLNYAMPWYYPFWP